LWFLTALPVDHSGLDIVLNLRDLYDLFMRQSIFHMIEQFIEIVDDGAQSDIPRTTNKLRQLFFCFGGRDVNKPLGFDGEGIFFIF
jgi:hypothetical protein